MFRNRFQFSEPRLNQNYEQLRIGKIGLDKVSFRLGDTNIIVLSLRAQIYTGRHFLNVNLFLVTIIFCNRFSS